MPEINPTHAFNLHELLNIAPPSEAPDFVSFWQSRHEYAMNVNPAPCLHRLGDLHPKFDCYDLSYRSTNTVHIGGWVLIPKKGPIVRAAVVGHGYGGREAPDFNLPLSEAAFLFPCFRGLSKSKCPHISDNPNLHVLHAIGQRDRYILGGCVDDLWLATSALLQLFPSVAGHVAYLGTSFGGGIGALALPWDQRIQRAHLNVPSFGNQPLRLKIPTWGSAGAVQKYQQEQGDALSTLKYFDAAVSARHIAIPVHIAAALSDPMVTPLGQFSLFNALTGEKKLFVLEKGHSEYPGQTWHEKALFSKLSSFFQNL